MGCLVGHGEGKVYRRCVCRGRRSDDEAIDISVMPVGLGGLYVLGGIGNLSCARIK